MKCLLLAGDAVLQVQQRFAGLTKPGAWQKVVSLHADAFWQRHGWKVIAGAAVVGAYFLWCGATFDVLFQCITQAYQLSVL